jgi:hypothetical protein
MYQRVQDEIKNVLEMKETKVNKDQHSAQLRKKL